jgi:hypothetical protein
MFSFLALDYFGLELAGPKILGFGRLGETPLNVKKESLDFF